MLHTVNTQPTSGGHEAPAPCRVPSAQTQTSQSAQQVQHDGSLSTTTLQGKRAKPETQNVLWRD